MVVYTYIYIYVCVCQGTSCPSSFQSWGLRFGRYVHNNKDLLEYFQQQLDAVHITFLIQFEVEDLGLQIYSGQIVMSCDSKSHLSLTSMIRHVLAGCIVRCLCLRLGVTMDIGVVVTSGHAGAVEPLASMPENKKRHGGCMSIYSHMAMYSWLVSAVGI